MSAALCVLRGFGLRHGGQTLLADVDLELEAGQSLALVGESGSGKSSLGLALCGLLTAGFESSGELSVAGRRWEGPHSAAAWSGLRGSTIGMVFQDPATAFDPRLAVGAQIAEGLRLHQGLAGEAARVGVLQALRRVGLREPERIADSLAARLSGGEQQRAWLAVALAGQPALLVADEPTSALDAGNAREIALLLEGLVLREGRALLWISHDLARVAEHCQRISVLYAGRIVESGPAAQLLARPRHPYTLGLLRAAPERSLGAGAAALYLRGQQEPPRARVSGCVLRLRCPLAVERCAQHQPLVEVGRGQLSACWRHQELPLP